MAFRLLDDVKNLRCPDTRDSIELWHETEKGFGVRVMRAKPGAKVVRKYLARYQHDGKDKKPAIGEVGIMGFEDAREKVRELRKLANKNSPVTLSQAFESYLTAKKLMLAPDTVGGYRARIDNSKDWLDLPLSSITEEMLTERYLEIAIEKSATAKGWAAIMHAIFERELKARNIQFNPVVFLAAEQQIYAKIRGSNTNFIRQADIPRFWQCLHTRLHPAARDFILVMLFTGFREGLAGSLEWESYNKELRAYRVYADQRGNKAKKLFWFPIPNFIAENVFERREAEQRAKYDGQLGKWVIESYKRRGSPYKNARGSFNAIQTDTGLYFSDHNMRDTFATIARRVLKDTLIVARLLSHNLMATDNDLLQHSTDYQGYEDNEFRSAVENVAAEILKSAGV